MACPAAGAGGLHRGPGRRRAAKRPCALSARLPIRLPGRPSGLRRAGLDSSHGPSRAAGYLRDGRAREPRRGSLEDGYAPASAAALALRRHGDRSASRYAAPRQPLPVRRLHDLERYTVERDLSGSWKKGLRQRWSSTRRAISIPTTPASST